ncbi:MAG: hypothetical protein AAF937_01780 [Planctomycetota bacterium]
MRVNCLHCGHAFGLDASYSDYEGMLRCPTCGGLLEARIEDGLIRGVRLGSLAAPPSGHGSPDTAETLVQATPPTTNPDAHRSAA